MVVLEYFRADGVCPFSEWVNKLDGSIKYRVQARILRLKEKGHFGFNRGVSDGQKIA